MRWPTVTCQEIKENVWLSSSIVKCKVQNFEDSKTKIKTAYVKRRVQKICCEEGKGI